MVAFVYILRCADGSYYVGSARGESLDRRLNEHQAGTYEGYTSKRRPVTLVYAEPFDRITDAMASMREQVAFMDQVRAGTETMSNEMSAMQQQIHRMSVDVQGIQGELSLVKDDMAGIATSVANINAEVAIMGHDMHRMAKPARTINRIFPFP